MKNTYYMILSVSLMLGLLNGCGGSATESVSQPNSTNTQEELNPEANAPIGDTTSPDIGTVFSNVNPDVNAPVDDGSSPDTGVTPSDVNPDVNAPAEDGTSPDVQ